MYAVFVIAAILLSVSPMHARTLLAALPACAPGHQFAPDDQAGAPRTATLHLLAATSTSLRERRTSHSSPVSGTVIAATSAAKLATEDISLLEHAPNAP